MSVIVLNELVEESKSAYFFLSSSTFIKCPFSSGVQCIVVNLIVVYVLEELIHIHIYILLIVYSSLLQIQR